MTSSENFSDHGIVYPKRNIILCDWSCDSIKCGVRLKERLSMRKNYLKAEQAN